MGISISYFQIRTYLRDSFYLAIFWKICIVVGLLLYAFWDVLSVNDNGTGILDR